MSLCRQGVNLLELTKAFVAGMKLSRFTEAINNIASVMVFLFNIVLTSITM
jgi:hypothetical protein